nr:MAG TPA: hypothetical protein [Caudoviricetes sp.]
MIINGKNFLLLEKRGCNINGGVPANTESDVGNYRVCTMGETIPGKDGRNYFLEFSLWQNRSQPRYTNKRTGAPLKHPAQEIINPIGLHIGTQYTDESGQSWRNLNLEQRIHKRNPSYTTAEILAIANEISAEHFDEIKWVCSFRDTVDHGANFTPAVLISAYAKRNRMETESRFGTLLLKLYTGVYKYLAYDVRSFGSRDNVTVILEEVEA